MAYHKATRGAAESTIRDQCHRIGQPRANDGAGNTEHLAHAGTASRTLITDYNDVTCADLSRQHGRHGGFFRIEDARWSTLLLTLDTGDLDHAAFRRERSTKNYKPTALLNRIVECPDYFLAGSLARLSGLFGEAATRHGSG